MSSPSSRSRARSRPSRDETAERLFVAAIELFESQGIGAASIGDITRAAGLSRGAFYSSFANKDELVVALLERHVQRAIARNDELARRYTDPGALVSALASSEGRDSVSRSASRVLILEFMLFVNRLPQYRPTLSKMLVELRTNLGQIAVASMRAVGVTREIDAEQTGALLLALEDGFDLHRMIDPHRTPQDSYFRALVELQQLTIAADRADNPKKRRGRAQSL